MNSAGSLGAAIAHPRPMRMAGWQGHAVLGGLLVFCAPAIAALAEQHWQTDTGSLTPLILATGAWSLLREFRAHRDLARPGPLTWGLLLLAAIAAFYIFASAISMTALMAVCAWAGGVACFWILFGPAMLRACWFPLLYLGLAVPLPYTVTVSLSAGLRQWIAQSAVWLADRMTLDVAVEQSNIFIDQYRLEVEAACAGSSSTFSLIAIVLLFTYWYRGRDWRRTAIGVLLAAPIALGANVLRVVALLLGVHVFGAGILDTVIHPVAGLISFVFALGLFLLIDRLGRWGLRMAERR